MKYLNKEVIKHLSFPDLDIQEMTFFPEKKVLKIYVEGAWLSISEGKKLGPGILIFTNWEDLSVTKYNYSTNQWANVQMANPEKLKAICEMEFSSESIFLSGFGIKSGQWIKWKIIGSEVHGEF